MKRLDRLTAILIHLQAKQVVTAQELATRFDVSIRTIYRDVKTLEEAGVPVGAEPRIGYFLHNYSLPPVMLDNTEASALLFGARLVQGLADQSVWTAYESALYKIKSVLKHSEKQHLEDLEPYIAVPKRCRQTPFLDTLLNTLQAALVQHRVIELTYYAIQTNSRTERAVEPIGLSYYGENWHLIAYCRLRRNYRDFRLDRILQASISPYSFAPQDRLSLQTYLDQLRQQERLEEAIVHFRKDVAQLARQQRYSYGFVAEEVLPDGVAMQFLTASLDVLSRWLLMFSDAIQVASPVALQVKMQEHAQAIQAYYLS